MKTTKVEFMSSVCVCRCDCNIILMAMNWKLDNIEEEENKILN